MCRYEDWLACAGIPNHINRNALVYQGQHPETEPRNYRM
jgi:hypothetical protein